MHKTTITIILILLIIIFIILFLTNKYSTQIRGHIMVILTVLRGIVSTNCFWWRISDFYHDKTGIDLYYETKGNNKTKTFNVFGKNITIVFDINFIKQILDNSPEIFGVGKIKYDFFKSFMRHNVGVSEGCPWKNRRKLNEVVLESDIEHHSIPHFNTIIDNNMKILPTTSKEFFSLGQKITFNIVFGENEPFKPIFNMLREANSILPLISMEPKIDKKTIEQYYDYIKRHIDNPIEGSLIYLSKSNPNNTLISDTELLHQVPHWIFPMQGLFSIGVPKLLILLLNHPAILHKAIFNISKTDKYIRNCILEMFRLNCPVNSTFRTTLYDYTLDENHKLKKGDQLLIINNPVMRDPNVFREPNRFIPERWNSNLEKSYYALMFNQGHQRCPGKELAISLISYTTNIYLLRIKENLNTIKFIPKLDTSYIPQMINPCTIQITSQQHHSINSSLEKHQDDSS